MNAIRGSWWSITINNPTEQDRQALKEPPTFVKRLKYQDEIGGDGTLHIQGAVNTSQVRFSAIKSWLKRAHIELGKDPKALLAYVGKTDTAVAGTQNDHKQEYMTMEKGLRKLAEYYVPPDPHDEPSKTWEEDHYWDAVKLILKESPSLVQLYTNPQMLRAWKNTRSVWLDLLEETDRQTDAEMTPE